jgi:photosystem II stability/assembly factor-like uncharacterized protein
MNLKLTIPTLLFLLITSFGITQVESINLGTAYEWRNLGPANQGGRITDIEADKNDFTNVFIAVASGGVWKSENAGTSWIPIFDDYETASIGDIALDPNNGNILWVGTGESNNRNSVSWGNGIYKSEDGGNSFENKGLESTHQIARVLVHPDNPDDVCACAIGHLWGYSGDRGLFQTKDGGETWNKLNNGLPDDGKTGCIDLVRDSKDPNILYAAFYHRLRKPWHFHSGGEQGGIYKSIDGGESWKKLNNGLPPGDTGRIGLAIYEKDPNILMAIIESEKSDTLSIPGSGIYRSEDAGENWEYINTYNNRPFYYSQIRINPLNDQKIYVLTTRFMVSDDGGKTLRNGSEDQEVHGDFHALWNDPRSEDRYYLGADKGLSITHDGGKHFRLIDNLPIAQYYRINFDMRDPYYVYGGLQDNGSYATSSFSRDARGILSDSNWKMHWGDGQDAASNPLDWTDMYTSMENGSYFKYNPRTRRIFSISPNGYSTDNYWDYFDKNEPDKKSASRFNWSAPLVMSPHNSNHIFVGGNHLYKSHDKGNSWRIISPDLTTNHPEKRLEGSSGGITPDNTGAETHCAITGISISHLDKNLIWVCTDDGNVQLTKDEGSSWTNVRANIKDVPEGIWASRIESSKFEKGRAYVSFDGHRSDTFEPWLFVTEDYGLNWKRITNGFAKNDPIRVIREDVVNSNLLFAGTETGVYYSSDQGSHWSRLKLNMPTVSVYDIKIHPRDNDILVGTHGRSLWVLDDISAIQQMSMDIAAKKVHLFKQKKATLWENVSRGGQRGHFWFAGDNPKSIENTSSVPRARFKSLIPISYKIGPEVIDSVLLQISSSDGKSIREIKLAPLPGIHEYYWDGEFSASQLSEKDIIQLDTILQTLVAEMGNSRIRRIYSAFQKTTNSEKIRKIIEPLTSGYLNFEFPKQYLIPKAIAGIYNLKIISGKEVTDSQIEIRNDPLLNSKL